MHKVNYGKFFYTRFNICVVDDKCKPIGITEEKVCLMIREDMRYSMHMAWGRLFLSTKQLKMFWTRWINKIGIILGSTRSLNTVLEPILHQLKIVTMIPRTGSQNISGGQEVGKYVYNRNMVEYIGLQ